LAPQRSGALCHEPTLSRRASLDHLIGTSEQCWRDRETQCLGRLEIDDHLELGRRLDGKVGRVCALQYAIDIYSGLCPFFDQIAAIGNQTTPLGKKKRKGQM
jgi:hypothetical protein